MAFSKYETERDSNTVRQRCNGRKPLSSQGQNFRGRKRGCKDLEKPKREYRLNQGGGGGKKSR